MGSSAKAHVAEDVEIVRRVLAHIDAGTTDEGRAWREPVDNYLNPQRFAAEFRMLRSLPSVFMPAAAVANPGDHAERVSFGVGLFAVRDRDRRVRVFRNACRHRGMAVVEGSGCSHALVCPYHGWTYRLDGCLAHVPHADGFPDLDMSARGLVEVDSHEAGGLIVIGALDPATAAPARDCADAALGSLTDASPWRAKLATANRLVLTDSTRRPMNWKVLVEQFLEGYHIRATHATTFYPLQYDNLNVVETFGPNSRITYPYRNIERLRGHPPSTWTADARVTYLYHLFPNVVLATFPDAIVMAAVDPVDVEHSTVSTYSISNHAQDKPPGGAEPDEEVRAESLLGRGATEDNAMSAGVQRGLHAGANAFLEFGRHESAIGHFHATLDDRLARMT